MPGLQCEVRNRKKVLICRPTAVSTGFRFVCNFILLIQSTQLELPLLEALDVRKTIHHFFGMTFEGFVLRFLQPVMRFELINNHRAIF